MKTFLATVITISDRASKGIYEDLSGKEIVRIMEDTFENAGAFINVCNFVIPDETILLRAVLEKEIRLETDFIITTGGTGIGPRDITPDVVMPMLTKQIPGIMELIRVKYGLQFASAALSRSVAGVANKSLVYCLPGSPKAVVEYMSEITKTIFHCHKMLHGSSDHNNS